MKYFNLAIIILIFLACSKKDSISLNTELNAVQAQYVSYITDGLISKRAPIRIILNTAVAKKQQELDLDEIIEFEPSIAGKVIWENASTFTFRPTSNLIEGTTYKASFYLNNIFDDNNIDVLNFSFEAVNNEILEATLNTFTPNDEKPDEYYIISKIRTIEPINQQELKAKVLINVNGEWAIKAEEATFKSILLKRADLEKNYELFIPERLFGNKENKSVSYKVYPIADFIVNAIEAKREGLQSYLQVVFSDEIDIKKDWSSFFTLEPNLQKTISISGSILKVTSAFESNTDYTLKVKKGIKSKYNKVLKTDEIKSLSFNDAKPEIMFSQQGVFLPSDNKSRVQFKAINVNKVSLYVEQIFTDNITFYLGSHKLTGEKKKQSSNSYYEDEYYDSEYNSLRLVGKIIYKQDLNLTNIKNEWQQHSIDLTEIIKKYPKGLYNINLSFKKENIMYDPKSSNIGDDDSYYSNPMENGYYYKNGKISKAIIKSDIALISKISDDEVTIFASNILENNSQSGVSIELRSLANEKLASTQTNGNGIATFTNIATKDIAYVFATFKDDLSIIKLNDHKLDDSNFETSGMEVASSSIKAFIYTDRGVYRPGDSIFVSLIARNADQSFPKNLPISFQFENPRGQIVKEYSNNIAEEGFYSQVLKTETGALTGNWRLIANVASKTFYYPIKIETILPNRFKVKTLFELSGSRNVTLTIDANYLFGNPASNMKMTTDIFINENKTIFSNFPDYVFSPEDFDFSAIEFQYGEQILDENGHSVLNYTIPTFSQAPGVLEAKVTTRVYEKGGRFTKKTIVENIFPFENYVGIKHLQSNYVASGDSIDVAVIVLDKKGKQVPSTDLTYNLFENKRYWWYDYGYDNFSKRYKNHQETRMIQTGKYKSTKGHNKLRFKNTAKGMALLEVIAPDGHKSSIFFNSYSWGDSEQMASSNTVEISTVKKSYKVGEKISLKVPNPKDAKLLVYLEKGHKVLSNDYLLGADNGESIISFAATEEMIPNIYASVFVLQAHAQSINDHPIRLYGVTPIFVEKENQEIKLSIESAEQFSAGKKVSIKIKASDKAQISIALVDEGLLDLTNFTTPNPLSYFFAKEKRMMKDFDNYDQFIGAEWGNIIKTFKIGGDYEAYVNDNQLSPETQKQLESVYLYQAPKWTNGDNELTAEFTLPDYVGSVKIMAIAASKGSYGSAEKDVKVKAALIPLVTMPRSLAMGDNFILPVQLISTENKKQTIKVSLETNDLVSVESDKNVSVDLEKSGEMQVRFNLKVNDKFGPATFNFVFDNGTEKIKKTFSLDVKSSSPRIYSYKNAVLDQNKLAVFNFDNSENKIVSTRRAKVSVSVLEALAIRHRLNYLIEYPYGCGEQTTSSVFPQLELKAQLKDSKTAKEIDDNINKGIARLKLFQLSNGGLAYWPGSGYENEWVSIYALQFLIAAKNKGYAVSNDFYESLINYNIAKAKEGRSHVSDQAFREYVLSLIGKADFAVLNYLKESELKALTNSARWYLIAAYANSNQEAIASKLITESDKQMINIAEYTLSDLTFYNDMQDQAVILSTLQKLGRTEDALKMYQQLVKKLNSQNWYSSSGIATALIAVNNFAETAGSKGNDKLKGSIKINGSSFSLDNLNEFTTDVKDLSQDFSVNLTSPSHAFVKIEESSISKIDESKAVSFNLNLEAKYYSDEGREIEINNLKQGQSFWIHYRVSSKTPISLKYIALSQQMPSGWELENMRLTNDNKPVWMSELLTNQEQYLDIRDDKIMWFFDFNYTDKLDFIVKVNTLHKGEFYLPPTKVEAMYNNKYRAIIEGKKVRVE